MINKMNTLSKFLVDQILIEENNIKKVVAIFPGRFQPMGKHHAEAFNWLRQKFPQADSYIATSDKVDIPKSPFTFQEKKKIINGYGISKVVMTKNPYNPTEILSKYDPETTVVVFLVGVKDMSDDPRFKIGVKKNGLPSYFQDFLKNKNNLVGFSKHAYLITSPHISLSIPGYNEMSGTEIRKVLGSHDIDDNKRHELFKLIFGYDNKQIYNLVVNKLMSLNEIMSSFVIYSDYSKKVHEVSTSSMQGRHFIDDGPDMFDDTNKRYKTRALKSAERLGWDVVDYLLGNNLIDDNNNILYPNGPQPRVSFMPSGVSDKFGDDIESDNQTHKLKNHRGHNRWQNYIKSIAALSGMQFVDFLSECINLKLIKEGGAYGHMNHPFDDNDLTFGDIKDLIKQTLQGELNSSEITEKVDGQNLMVTWKDNSLRAARNNTQIKNPISISEIAKMFSGRGDIEDAFVYAMKDLDSAISKLSEKDKKRIFDNGKNFMNLEIIYPATKNVIDYDRSVIQFHGALIYDENGKTIGEVPNSGTLLANMIKKINQDTQSHFNILAPQNLKLQKSINFAANQDKFLQKINKLQSEFNLKDIDTIGMYHQSWWTEFINKKAKTMKYDIPQKVVIGLTKRWGFADKSYDIRTIKNDISNDTFLNWVLDYDKNEHKTQFKINITPFENLFLELGAEILKNVEGFLSVNPDKTVQDIRNQCAQTIHAIRNSGDIDALKKMETQLKRIQDIGGFKQIVPTEGIVIKYKGKTYKLSGIFAPINQLLGIVRYSR